MCRVADPQLRNDKRIEIDTSFRQANRVDLTYDARIFVTDGHGVGETSKWDRPGYHSVGQLTTNTFIFATSPLPFHLPQVTALNAMPSYCRVRYRTLEDHGQPFLELRPEHPATKAGHCHPSFLHKFEVRLMAASGASGLSGSERHR